MRNLFAFFWRQNHIFLFIILELIALWFIQKDTYYQRSVILNSTNQFTGSVFTTVNNISEYFTLKETNKILAAENADFLTKSKSAFINTTNKPITLNDTVYNQQYIFSDAKVISNSVNRRNNYLMLNKGSNHGISADMAVISSNGIVGIVKDVSDNFCSVISLLHQKAKISVKILKNNYAGTIVWDGDNYLKGHLKDIPFHVMLSVGDTIITSGNSLMFPEGIMVGTIDEFDIVQGDNFYTIKVSFSTEFKQLAYVYIVTNVMKEEQQKLIEATIDE